MATQKKNKHRQVQTITVVTAEAILTDILSRLFTQRDLGGNSTEEARELEDLMKKHGLVLFERCPGDAHSNPNIDHCAVCMSFQWGAIARPVKIISDRSMQRARALSIPDGDLTMDGPDAVDDCQ